MIESRMKLALKFAIIILLSAIYIVVIMLCFADYKTLKSAEQKSASAYLTADSTLIKNSICVYNQTSLKNDTITSLTADLSEQFGESFVGYTAFHNIESTNNYTSSDNITISNMQLTLLSSNYILDTDYITLSEGVMPNTENFTDSCFEALAPTNYHYDIGSTLNASVSCVVNGQVTTTNISIKIVGLYEPIIAYSFAIWIPYNQTDTEYELVTADIYEILFTFKDAETATSAMQYIYQNTPDVFVYQHLSQDELYLQNTLIYSAEAEYLLILAILASIIITICFVSCMIGFIKKGVAKYDYNK